MKGILRKLRYDTVNQFIRGAEDTIKENPQEHLETVPVFSHRAYRRISDSWKYALLEFCVLVIPIETAFLFFYPEITRFIVETASIALSSYVPSGEMIVFQKSFLQGTIYLLDIPGKYPSPLFSFVFFCIAVMGIFLVWRIKLYQPLGLWLIFLSCINILSSLVFILLPHTFPYTMLKFSELYITTEVGMWLFVPVIMGIAILPIPAGIFTKFITVLLTALYSVLFGTVRYVVFLFVISKLSYIFMPVLYFSFGPLVDFVYIVGIYSLYVSKVAENITQDFRVWKWVF